MDNISSYEMTYEKVKSVINKFDPIGLISGGAPEDEYDSQIKKIVSLIQKNAETDNLTEEIYNIFTQSFGKQSVGGKDLYLRIVEDLKEKK